MDITDALAPTSDQLDAIELVNPRTFMIGTEPDCPIHNPWDGS